MKPYLSSVLSAVAAFALTATIIPFTAHASEPVEIVKPGDSALSCPALAAEINALGQAPAANAQRPKKHGFGFLKVVGAMVPGVGMLSGAGGALVSTAAATGSALANGNASDRVNDATADMREAMAGGSPAQQRKARLLVIFDDKHC